MNFLDKEDYILETTAMLIEFEKWCPKCKNNVLAEEEDPCDECLEQGWNEDSVKPVRFEPKE